MTRDKQLRERLLQLDDAADIDVTSWEADFIENVCFKYEGPLSKQQRATADQILDKYGY